MYRRWVLLAAVLLSLQIGHAQRTTQEMVMMQYFDRRLSELEDRVNRCDQSVQTYEQKLYDISKHLRGHLDGLGVFKAEMKSLIDSVVMRVERTERDIEYMEQQSPLQPCVDVDEAVLEEQVKEAHRETKSKLEQKTDCDVVIKGVKSLKILKRAGEAQGSWMKDPSKGSSKVYFFSGTRNSTFLEFSNLQAFTKQNSTQGALMVQLPFPWQGTGHAVYHGFVYYHKAGTVNEIVKVHIRNGTFSDNMLLPGAGRLPTYSLTPQTIIDLAVDELGLWAIHADPDFGGNLVITKLDRSSLAVEHTWDTECKSRDAEASFLICGTLHVVYNSRSGGRSSVQCMYDIHDTFHSPESPVFFFPKRYSSHSSMRYHPKDKQLYSWDDGYQTIYKVQTKRKNEVAST
ncbi:olfactomedin-like protein 3A [Paramormyrops kingsleyae]|uniref:Olfactomedin like 1 n=1 Tax=Paramormyrops kingsleyae TaxID=1676925 RepID=A0A3B3QS54_9TELE|nr:olfactomedin-like protein 1 [Paramormyrops kingsleyae]